MKYYMQWIFKGYVQGVNTPQLKGKIKDISNMSGDELLNMITTLLAQNETVRLIIEQGDINNGKGSSSN